MSATAVVILTAIARDEFERSWHGFEEPFEFIDPVLSEEEPVTEFSVTLDDTTYTLKARDVAQFVIGQLEGFRQDVEDEDEPDEDEDDRPSARIFRYLSDEEKDEEAQRRLWQYWSDQLEGEAEFMVVLETRLGYLVQGFSAMVADFTMIGERMPDLRPILAEKLQETYDHFIELLDGAGVE